MFRIKYIIVTRIRILLIIVAFILVVGCSSPPENDIPNFELIRTIENVEIFRTFIEGKKNGTVVNNITCILLKPKGSGPFPGFILNHGGYNSATTFSIGSPDPVHKVAMKSKGIYLAKEGYVTLACDLTHYDQNMEEYNFKIGKGSIHVFPKGEEPGASPENVRRALRAIQIMKQLDFVDNNRIYMLGNSMGGFLTIAVSAETNDLKAAIVSVSGIEDGNPQTRDNEIVELGSPPESVVKDINCPMLILAGELDSRVDVKYPKHLKELLDKHGKESKLIIYPDAAHGVLGQKRDESFQEIFNFIKE